MHAGKRSGYHKGSATVNGCFNTFPYEQSMVFLTSRQKNEQKNSYPTEYIPHLTQKVIATRPEKKDK